MTKELLNEIENDYWNEKADPIDMAEVFDLAIKALEQQPSEDCVNRDALINELKCGYWDKNLQSAKNDPCIVDAMIDWSIRTVKSQPSVTPQQTRWIPVSERLPEDGQHVMVTFGGKIAFCLAQDNNGTLTEITSLISKDANVLWLYPEDEWGDGYEAWMPLPSPYKAESEDRE